MVAAPQRQQLIINYSFTSEQVRKAVICTHNWPWNYDTKHTKHAHTHIQTHMPTWTQIQILPN